MKELRKMLVLNWHYFSHTEIEFKTLNFLTGQNAAGKSTLIDALQVVMLGETKSYIFNKAANDKSERTLIGYLKGELGDDGGTGFRYLRDGDFNTYIVLEFHDSVKNKDFIAGVIFDVYADGTQKHNFFIADCAIPKSGFLEKGIPFNRDQLKNALKSETKNRFNWFDTQNTYRSHLMAKCGNIKHKFFSLFKKAVPFSPIVDIEQFITEYITDITGRPNIEDMQENLRYYKRLEKEAEAIQDRVFRLDEISQFFKVMQSKKRQQHLHEAISATARLEISRSYLNRLKSEHVDHERLYLENAELIEVLQSKKNQLENSRTNLISEKAESDIQKRLNKLYEEENRLLLKQMALESDLNKSIGHLKALADEIHGMNDTFLTEDEVDSIRIIKGLSMESMDDATSEQLMAFESSLKRWAEHFQTLKYDTEKAIELLNSDLEGWAKRLDALKRGIKDYPNDVLTLVRHLEKAGVKDVYVLADVLEIKNERWKSAIEGYLHTQKFYILTADEDYEKALETYDDLRNTSPVYSVGLIDSKKLKIKRPTAESGSLAEHLSTEHPGARVFIDYVLGSVICVDQVKSIRDHSTAITDTGMLYQNFVARQLHPNRWATPFIGKNAIELQIEQISEQVKHASIEKRELGIKLDSISLKCKIKALSKVEMEIHMDRFESLKVIEELINEVYLIRKERDNMDLSYLQILDDQLKELELELERVTKDIATCNRTEGALSTKLETLIHSDIPKAKFDFEECQRETEAPEYSLVVDEALERFEKLIEEQSPEAIATNYSRSSKAAKTDKENQYNILTKHREDYNRIYHMSHDVLSKDNTTFDNALIELRETKLPDYLEKIKEAQEQATIQFKDEFLSKLKENFDSVFAQIKELNIAIKDSPFGTDNYRFEVKPKPDMRHFYDMIMDELLLGSGMNIMSYSFNEKHKEAIDELFRMIVESDETSRTDKRSIIEKQISYYTDYRSYLNFDFVVTDQDGEDQRLSKTLLKKSGGETQTPFYLAVLASFAHMYRVNQKGFVSETIRLIIFDEAFSKMDQQRIAESLKLLRKFKLQAIISAPPDKIMDITPHVDQNLCVFRQNNISFVQAYEQKELQTLIE